MKKLLLGSFAVALLAAWVVISSGTLAQSRAERGRQIEQVTSFEERTAVPEISTTLVISQFQAGGAVPDDEFIEIHNVSNAPIDLNGYRIVYSSKGGTLDLGPLATWSSSTVLQPGQFYLIADVTGYDGTVSPNQTYDPAAIHASMSSTDGGLALKNSGGTIIDAVGWGSPSGGYLEGTRTVAPGNNNSDARKQNGCQDTDSNSNDFQNLVPSAPRNASSPLSTCSSDPSQLSAALTANPSTVVASGTTLLTVAVVPATNPPSTGIQVTGNLSQIGGSSLQTFFDDGTNGDETAGDNTFSYLASIPAGIGVGTYNVTAVASDAQSGPKNLSVNITVNGVPENDNPLLFGNPTGATADVGNPNNYLMIKPQYSLSYNDSKREPNWTAWRLDSSWIGGSGRSGSFAQDTTLPAGWYRVDPSDYSEPVYDRGHMCPSGDRTRSATDNQATFLMTNMVPQLPDNNQGPWADFENYCRTLAGQGKEIYIISGPAGQDMSANGGRGYIGNGVVVPAQTWKVVLVLPNGTNDLQRVGRSTRMFGVIMSNTAITRSAPWRNFRVTVDQVEALTGYDFFSNLSPGLQVRLERRVDTQ